MATERATKTEGEALEERTGRRRLFALGAAGLGVIAGLGLRSNTAAAAHGSPVLGVSSDPAEAGVRGDHHTGGIGVHGTSGSGDGVRGEAASSLHAGVTGINSDPGFNAAGVRGFGAGNGMGVDGQSVDGSGVSGSSHNGIGVSAGSLNGIAFEAFAPAGIAAIRVGGKARFSTVGGGSIPAKASSAFVTHLSVTASSHVTVALTSDPGSGAVVQWIERAPGSGFTVHLDRRARDGTSFSFFIVEPFV